MSLAGWVCAAKAPAAAEEGILAMGANGVIRCISAVTLAVRDMACAIAFYEKLGFELFYGGPGAGFCSLRAGEALVNLATTRDGYDGEWWGRVIFRVVDVDAKYRVLAAEGFEIEAPKDAPWGERFFHVRDPDGHELSFAAVLERSRGGP